MRTLFFFLSVLACVAQIGLRDPGFVAQLLPKGGSAYPNYLVHQNFEGTGYDNGESWNEAGAVNEDATSPDIPEGVQCLDLGAAGQGYVGFAAQSEVYAYFRYRLSNNNSGSPYSQNLIFYSADFAVFSGALYTSLSHLFTLHECSNPTQAGAVSADTWYHIWMHYKKGTGANGIMEVARSTDGTKPTSGDFYVGCSNSDRTVDMAWLLFDSLDATYIDKVRVVTAANSALVWTDNPD